MSSATRTLAELWSYRELVWSLVVRDMKAKYQRSVFGFVWTVLNPAVTVLILMAVFSYVVRIPIENYWAFLLSGYFVWHFISQVVGSGTHLLEAHAGLSRSVAFPKEVLVLSAALSRFLEFLVELLPVLALLVILHHGGVPLSVGVLPFLLLVTVLLALGLLMPVVVASAYYKDTSHMVPMVLLAFFYLSPVFYSVELAPDEFQAFYAWNPFSGLLTLFHRALYEGLFPPFGLMAQVTAISFTILLLGYAVFHRHKNRFAEIV